jgi:TPR repeat protein
MRRERGVPQAARWCRGAADAHNPNGAFRYAEMLESGSGVARSPAEAVLFYKSAADAGHDGAQSKYGLILETGALGVAANLEEAVKSYKMSSDQGSPSGMLS